jgi:hypothetical protein
VKVAVVIVGTVALVALLMLTDLAGTAAGRLFSRGVPPLHPRPRAAAARRRHMGRRGGVQRRCRGPAVEAGHRHVGVDVLEATGAAQPLTPRAERPRRPRLPATSVGQAVV